MLQTISWALPELLLFLTTALATHYFMSFAQTLMHRTLGHQPIGRKFFRNHLNFHHTYYCDRSSGLGDLSWGQRKQYTVLLYSSVPSRSVCIFRIADISLRGAGDWMWGVVLRARLS